MLSDRLFLTTRENSKTRNEEAAVAASKKFLDIVKNSPRVGRPRHHAALIHLPTSAIPLRTIIYILCNAVSTMRDLKYDSTFITCTHTHTNTRSLGIVPQHSSGKYIVRTRIYTNTMAQVCTEVAGVGKLFKIFQPQAPLLKCTQRNCSTGSPTFRHSKTPFRLAHYTKNLVKLTEFLCLAY